MKEKDFQPHEIEWTDAKVQRLWDFYGMLSGHTNTYFSKHSGAYIIRQIGRVLPFTGRVLDFGCGPGHLMEQLLDTTQAEEVVGLEFSEESVDEAERRLKSRRRYGGTVVVQCLPCQLPENTFDRVVAVEVIEHLDDSRLDSMFDEARRLLKPSGFLIVTTPNAEDMDAKKVMCPECGCIFHMWQHVRCWTSDSLTEKLVDNGFRVSHCTTTCFGSIARRLWYRSQRKMPHLFAVAQPK